MSNKSSFILWEVSRWQKNSCCGYLENISLNVVLCPQSHPRCQQWYYHKGIDCCLQKICIGTANNETGVFMFGVDPNYLRISIHFCHTTVTFVPMIICYYVSWITLVLILINFYFYHQMLQDYFKAGCSVHLQVFGWKSSKARRRHNGGLWRTHRLTDSSTGPRCR